MRTTSLPLLLSLPLLACVACGGDDGPDWQQVRLPSLDDICQSVEGLTGNAILAKRTEAMSGTLAYITGEGDPINPTPFTLGIAWPAEPAATCYPAYVSENLGGPQAETRVAIEGLTLTFETDDGQFDERLSAKAWLISNNGMIAQSPALVAVTRKSKLKGSWEPLVELVVDDPTISFIAQLFGDASGASTGHVGMAMDAPALLEGGVFGSRFAAAIWPAPGP